MGRRSSRGFREGIDRALAVRIGAIALSAGVTAGLVAWIACEWAHDVFRPRLFEVPKWEAVWMESTRNPSMPPI